MDNYGSSQHPYGYPNPSLYPNNAPPYPPPDPHAPSPYPYPPNPQYYSYPPPPPQHSLTPYSTHMEYSSNYSYPPPPPLHTPPQTTSSSHGSFDFHMHQPPHSYPNPPQVPPQEWSGVSQTSDSFNHPPHSSPSPPLDDLMNNVSLSDNNPPRAPRLLHSDSIPSHGRRDEFYGYSNHSSSSLDQGGYENSAHSDDSAHNQSLQIVPVEYKGSLRVMLLHGNLDIWIHGAKNLPNMDMFHKTLGDMLRLPGNVSNKIEGNMKITSDPYVSISVTNAVIGRTFVISNSENPVWEQHFFVPVAHHAAEIHFVVKDSDVVGSQLIGVVAIPVDQIYSGERVQGTYPILSSNGKPCKPGAVLSVSIQYIPIEKLSIFHQGIGAGPDYIGVPGTYFPLRKGGMVTLYQDAHVPDGCLPNVVLDNGMYYAHGKCWQDIFDAIHQAQRLVYITGWSVWHKVRLVRDAANASNYSLGELLRSKSSEGVRVLLLVWDDPTSRSILGYKVDGVMATHDEDTRRFFKHSSVQVLLCPRIAGKRHSWAKQTVWFDSHSTH